MYNNGLNDVNFVTLSFIFPHLRLKLFLKVIIGYNDILS